MKKLILGAALVLPFGCDHQPTDTLERWGRASHERRIASEQTQVSITEACGLALFFGVLVWFTFCKD